MDEFEAPEGSGAKAMRETIDRKSDENAKLLAELESLKAEKMDGIFNEIGLDVSKGFGKALKQVYEGEASVEAVTEFAKAEYGFEAGNVAQEEVTPPVEEQPVQDDARARVAALDANSQSDVPTDVLEDLQNIIAKGTPKDSIRAKLTLMEDEKTSKN
jgi:hypothetical protein|tara:strand:- start:425 stop:898 length:474 start_codon:yes stop_codon:yes gene_type:complete